jgi:hypothetical protein
VPDVAESGHLVAFKRPTDEVVLHSYGSRFAEQAVDNVLRRGAYLHRG